MNKYYVQERGFLNMAERIFTSPAKYIQGKNAIEKIGTELKEIGSQAAVIADEIVWDIAADKVVDTLKNSNINRQKSYLTGNLPKKKLTRLPRKQKNPALQWLPVSVAERRSIQRKR